MVQVAGLQHLNSTVCHGHLPQCSRLPFLSHVPSGAGGSAGPPNKRSSFQGLADSISMQAIQEDAPLLRPGGSVSPFEAFSHRWDWLFAGMCDCGGL